MLKGADGKVAQQLREAAGFLEALASGDPLDGFEFFVLRVYLLGR
jgi:hypothetical protein